MWLTIFGIRKFYKNMDSEKASGAVFGLISGVVTTANGMDIAVTFGIAIVTGFLGAAGAHLFKVIVKKWKER